MTELQKIVMQFRPILLQKMAGKQDKEKFAEVVLVMLVGILCGHHNPNQIAEQLGIPPNQLYKQLQQMNANQWRKLLEQVMLTQAVKRLKEYESLSPASRSRRRASMAVDDSVVRRFGEVLSYVWKWYSGQLKRVTNGQDLLGIVLYYDGAIIPISLVWMSKTGPGGKSKKKRLLKELERLKAYFEGQGIDLTRLGISFDSWFMDNDLSEGLEKLGFEKQVIAAKSNTVLKVGSKRKQAREHYEEAELKTGWGNQKTPCARIKGLNPKLGKSSIIMFEKKRTKTFALICPSRLLRQCEALRLWENHHAVETFWKRMKSWLGLGKMQLRGREGAWAELCLRVLAYFLGSQLMTEDAGTFAQLSHKLRRQATFADLILNHFHLNVC
jgi:Transposase DDE domain